MRIRAPSRRRPATGRRSLRLPPARGLSPSRAAIRRVLYGPRPGARTPLTLRRTPDPISDPQRFERLHEHLFVSSPTPTGAALTPWVQGTETQIKQDFKTSMLREMEQNPRGFIGQITPRTTEQQAEADAIAIDARLHGRYPQISRQLSEAEIRQTVVVFAPDFEPHQAPSAGFLEDWIDNQLPRRTDIETFDLQPTSSDYRQIVTDLATDSGSFSFDPLERGIRRELQARGTPQADIDAIVAFHRQELQGKSWSWLFNRKASRTGAFEGVGHVFISEGLDEQRRRANIIHELVHLYAHPDYERWVGTTTSPRLFGEGFTEHLARQAMTTQELQGHRSYADNLQVLRARVLPFISLDDLARAYFQAEVWRLEARSAVAQELFQAQVGLDPQAPRNQEVAQSATSSGIVQEVETGRHYRFMDLEVGGVEPKAEHEVFFRTRILPQVTADPSLRLRFVGHASSTGASSFNQQLSEERAAAFYSLALREGVPRGQLLDADHPAGLGEDEPTAGNDDVHGRAFNRRVELFLTRQIGP